MEKQYENRERTRQPAVIDLILHEKLKDTLKEPPKQMRTEKSQREMKQEESPNHTQTSSDETLTPAAEASSNGSLFKNNVNLPGVIDKLQSPRWDIVLQGMLDMFCLCS